MNWIIYRYLFPASRSRVLGDQYSNLKNRTWKGDMSFIFTTTDKDVNRYEDWQIIRIPRCSFLCLFKDRRFAIVDLRVLQITNNTADIIHTQTEFLWFIRDLIARVSWNPVIHTYHTQYEDYVHYIASDVDSSRYGQAFVRLPSWCWWCDFVQVRLCETFYLTI